VTVGSVSTSGSEAHSAVSRHRITQSNASKEHTTIDRISDSARIPREHAEDAKQSWGRRSTGVAPAVSSPADLLDRSDVGTECSAATWGSRGSPGVGTLKRLPTLVR